MMSGQKWNAFVLDLSFLGWDILSIFTLGILSVLYVEPYKNLTMAGLYESLSEMYGHPAGTYEEPTNEYTNFNPYQAYYEYTHPQYYTPPVQPTNNTGNVADTDNATNTDNNDYNNIEQ